MDIEEIIESTTQVFAMRYWSDPVLSMVCDPVRDTEFGSKLEAFASRMVATMNTYRGIGLAAPQVGVPIRMFIMHFPEAAAKEGKLSTPPLAVCNPSLQFSGGDVYGIEGCLSFPSLFEQVVRRHGVTMRYFTVLGEEREIELTDMNARVAQHEADHLDGIMFFDRERMSKQMGKALLRKWDKVKGGYIK